MPDPQPPKDRRRSLRPRREKASICPVSLRGSARSKAPLPPRLELIHVDQQWQAHHHHHESRHRDANPLYDSAHSRTPPLSSLLLCQWHKAPPCASEQSSDFFPLPLNLIPESRQLQKTNPFPS